MEEKDDPINEIDLAVAVKGDYIRNESGGLTEILSSSGGCKKAKTDRRRVNNWEVSSQFILLLRKF